MTSIKHGNVIERIALFGVAISFKSRTRVVAFSVARLLKSRWQSRKYDLMHQAKWRESQRRNWTIPWKTWLPRNRLRSSRHICFQRYMLLSVKIAREYRRNFWKCKLKSILELFLGRTFNWLNIIFISRSRLTKV